MGWYSILASCGGCGRMFSANPERVPCYPVDLDKPPGPPNYRLSISGRKEPFCEECFEALQVLREQAGAPRQHVHPEAWGAAETI